MNIIPSYVLKYNISVDGGDYISNILFMKNTILPATIKMSFIIPDADIDYNIKIVMGDNILSNDNMLLHTVNINYNTINNKNIKVLYMTIILLPFYIVLYIDMKNCDFYHTAFPYYTNNMEIITYNKDIDITSYRLQFELKQIITIIDKKINTNSIIMSQETRMALKDKLVRLENNLNNIDCIHISNAKMLEIKNNLKTKFFID